jgi:hypothetical protein
MERKHHHSHSDRQHGAGAEHDRHDGGTGRDPGRRVGGGGSRELLASEDEDLQDEGKEAAADEDGGPVAEASAKKLTKATIKQQVRNASEAVKENECSIARGTYDTLKEPDDGKSRSAGFFGTLFHGLTDVGVSTLLSKINPGTAVGAALFAVYNAAKAEVAKQLPKPDAKNKVVASEFVESYVRHIISEWRKSADRLEVQMQGRSKKMLLSLRKQMRKLVDKTTIDNPKIKDSLLTAWVAALNREHKQEDKSRDYTSETSGRLHLVGVNVFPPGKGQKAGEQIHGLTARVDGTGSIRTRIGLRRLGAVQVPVTVAGLTMPDRSVFSFGIGPSDNGVPTMGPTQEGAQDGLKRYGGLQKLWDKMKGQKVDDLVGDNKNGGKNDAIQGGD